MDGWTNRAMRAGVVASPALPLYLVTCECARTAGSAAHEAGGLLEGDRSVDHPRDPARSNRGGLLGRRHARCLPAHTGAGHRSEPGCAVHEVASRGRAGDTAVPTVPGAHAPAPYLRGPVDRQRSALVGRARGGAVPAVSALHPGGSPAGHRPVDQAGAGHHRARTRPGGQSVCKGGRAGQPGRSDLSGRASVVLHRSRGGRGQIGCPSAQGGGGRCVDRGPLRRLPDRVERG